MPGSVITNLQVGQSFKKEGLFGYRYVITIPEEVAHTWITRNYPNSPITLQGQTVSQVPIKDWDSNIAIVVGEPECGPGLGVRKVVIEKTASRPPEYRLYRSEIIPEKE